MRVMEAVSASDPSAAHLGHLQFSGESTEELETTQEKPQPNEVPAPPITSRVTAKTLFSHPDAHPLVLDLALLRHYGIDWLEWEPETIRHYTAGEIGQISDLNLSKVMACKTLHLVDSFWKQWEVFVWCTMPLNAVFPDFQVMQVPSVAQTAVAVDIAKRIRTDVEWSNEVKLFMATVFRHDDIFYPIPPLDFVHIDIDGLPIDQEEIKKRWPSVRVSHKAPTDETITDEQLRRLLSVQEYLDESRARLRAQLPLVHHA